MKATRTRDMNDEIRLRVPSELKQWLQEHAASELTDVSTLVRGLILDYRRQVQHGALSPSEVEFINEKLNQVYPDGVPSKVPEKLMDAILHGAVTEKYIAGFNAFKEMSK
jgi:hypothetical protein